MSELVLPVVVLLASLAATYFFCLRPMQRGQCGLGRQAGEQVPSAQAAELAKLREQVEALKAGQHQSSRP